MRIFDYVKRVGRRIGIVTCLGLLTYSTPMLGLSIKGQFFSEKIKNQKQLERIAEVEKRNLGMYDKEVAAEFGVLNKFNNGISYRWGENEYERTKY